MNRSQILRSQSAFNSAPILEEFRQKLRDAHRILITGRIASVQTARAAIALARKLDATIDFDEHGSVTAHVQAMQRSYFYGASIAEVREQSDMILVVEDGSLLTQFPMLPAALRNDRKESPTILVYGPRNPEALLAWRQCGFPVWSIECSVAEIPKALSQWQRLAYKTMTSHSASSALLHRFAESKYLSIVWSAGSLPRQFADLWIERLAEWIFHQNELRRCVGLPLSSLDGTFQQACTWLTGFPGRLRFSDGRPCYDPHGNDYRFWIQTEQASDCNRVVVLIDETSTSVPFELPYTTQPMEVIRLSNHEPGLPVAIAGCEFAADVFRSDLSVLAHVCPGNDTNKNTQAVPCAADWLERLGA